MSMPRRSDTWFELSVPNPVMGTVFVHCEKKNRPLIVCKIDHNEVIYRTDMDGSVTAWGSLDDWRDEFRRRTIKVVYDPSAQEAA